MLTFLGLWEQMQDSSENPPLEFSGGDSRSMQVVRAGLNLRGEDSSRTFWDDFLQVCLNSEGLAELLQVRPEQVSGWRQRVQQMVERADDQDDNSSDKKNVLPTGLGGNDPAPNPF